MKTLIFISLIAAALYFGFTPGEDKTISFNNEEYKIARTEGKNGFYKYHYTVSGRDSGLNDYIEVLKFDKSSVESDRIKGVSEFVKKNYKTEYVQGSRGEFGVFGPQNNNYAYTVKSETDGSYWFVNYVNKTGSVDSGEAKSNAAIYISNLEGLVSELENR